MKLNVRVAGDRLRIAGVGLSLLALVAGILLFAGGHGSMAAGVSANRASSPWQVNGAGRYPHATRSGSDIAFASIPLSFEANQGQTGDRVKFLARGGGYTLFLTQDEAALKLPSSAKHSALDTQRSGGTTSVVRMKLVGANARAVVSGSEPLPSRSNYFIGKDPSQWRRNVVQFARVRYGQVYPGIDLVYYGNQGRLEYDFEVAPGADPEQIGLQIEGAQKLQVSAKGDLVAQTIAGDLQLHAPEVYQRIGDQKQAVVAKFLLRADNKVRFELGEYDRSRELVIDPVLSFSTFLGGTGDEGCGLVTGTITSGCPAIAVDAARNIYVAGTTTSTDFPASTGAFQTTPQGSRDVFVTKYNTSGAVVFSTYLGGTGDDTSVGVGVDSVSGNVYVAGNTTSQNTFPVTPSAFQSAGLNAFNHVFVTVLNSAGSALVYSTQLSGSGTDVATGLAVDGAAGAYVTGTTTSTDSGTGFPSTGNGFQVSSAGTNQFFFTKVDTSASGSSSVPYSSYLGGNTPNPGVTAGGGIAVDANRNVYLTGGTNLNMPLLNAAQPSAGGGLDAFVAKFNLTQPGAAGEVYLTYLGGSGDEIGYGVAVDNVGNAYVTGSTTSFNLPIPATTAPFQRCLNLPGTTSSYPTTCPNSSSAMDAFVGKIAATGNPTYALTYATYLGGGTANPPGNDRGLAIAADANQLAHVTGLTTSSDFPATVTGTLGGSQDAFVSVLATRNAPANNDTTGAYSTLLGGGAVDDGTGIAIDANTTNYVAGETSSGDFPKTNSSSLQGTSDAFVSVIPIPTAFSIAASTTPASPSVAGLGNQVTFSYAIKNTGTSTASNVIFIDNLPSAGATFSSATATPGSCTAAVNATVTCAVGSLGVGGQATVKVVLTATATGTLSNSGNLLANGTSAGSSSASVTVVDFKVGLSPSTQTVVAGNTATYQVQLSIPSGQANFYPDAVSLSCSAGVPTGAACTFSTNPITLTSTSPISSTLTLTTTARPVTTGRLIQFRTWYAALLPIGGLTFLGVGMGSTRRRRWMIGLFAVLVFGVAGLQLACSSGSGTTTPPSGTPAGTYPITLTGTSGSASHAVRMTLIVQ